MKTPTIPQLKTEQAAAELCAAYNITFSQALQIVTDTQKLVEDGKLEDDSLNARVDELRMSQNRSFVAFATAHTPYLADPIVFVPKWDEEAYAEMCEPMTDAQIDEDVERAAQAEEEEQMNECAMCTNPIDADEFVCAGCYSDEVNAGEIFEN